MPTYRVLRVAVCLCILMASLQRWARAYLASSRDAQSLSIRKSVRWQSTSMGNKTPSNSPKDKRRRQPLLDDVPLSSDGRGGARGGMKTVRPGSGRSNYGASDDLAASSPGDQSHMRTKPADPWKVLLRKLDTTKAATEKFGKKVQKVENNAPDELQCSHFGTCAGCSIKGNFVEIPIVKQAKAYFTSEGIAYPVHVGTPHGWRTHAKLAVQPMSRWGGLKIGLYKEGTHDVEAIPGCRVHHPRINEAVEELRRAAMDVGVKGYEPAKNGLPPSGDLRYVQMSVERESGKVQLVLVWNAQAYKDAEQTLPRLVKRLRGQPELWHSVSVNFQTSESNAIFNFHPKAWKLLWGPPLLREKIGLSTFFFRPQIFRQANLDAFESGIIPAVLKNIPPGSRVAELYSGLGVLGLNAAQSGKAHEVLCSDSNEYVDEVFDRCADTLNEDVRESVFYENMPAEEAIAQGQCDEAQVLIVDPPRRGLDEGVLKLLVGTHETARAPALRRLVYVSCGFDALERDSRAMLSSGFWKLRSAEGFILFPGSDHVETVAVFDRIGTGSSSRDEDEDREDDPDGRGRGTGSVSRSLSGSTEILRKPRLAPAKKNFP